MYKYLYNVEVTLISIFVTLFLNSCNSNNLVGPYIFPNVQWTKTHLPDSIHITTLAVTKTNIFAGTLGDGIYRSSDNGVTWKVANTGLTNLYVEAFSTSDSNIYVGTWGDGVFVSTNNGASWNATSQTGTLVSSFTIIGKNLITGTASNGILLSMDNGTSWNFANNGLTTSHITCLAVSGTNMFAGTTQGIFLSTDSGSSWNAVNSGLANKDVTALAVSGTNIFAGTYSGGIYISVDDGKNWNTLKAGLGSNHTSTIIDFTVYGNTIFVAMVGGVYYSTDNGTSWSDADLFIATALAISGNTLFAGGIGIAYHPL